MGGSVRIVIPGLFALLILVSTGLLVSASLAMQFREADQSAKDLLDLMGGRVEDLVEREISDLQTLVRIYSREFELNPDGFNRGRRNDHFIQRLRDSIRTQPLMKRAVSLGWINQEGQGFLFDRRPTATPVMKSFDLSKSRSLSWFPLEHSAAMNAPLRVTEVLNDPRVDPRFNEAIERRDEVITDVHPSPWSTDSWVITLYQPLFAVEGPLRGVLMADLDLRAISIGLRDLKLPLGTSLVIFNRGGDLIASSLRQTDEARGATDPQHLSPVAANGDPTIHAVHLAVEAVGGYPRVDAPRLVKQEGPDDLYYVRMGPLSRKEVQDWAYAIAIPRQVLIEPMLAGIRVSMVLGAFLVLMAILAGGLLARWITRPILLLGRAASAVKAHQFESPEMPSEALQRESSRANEFGQLAALFVHMMDEVRDRHRLLEAQLEQLRVNVDQGETMAQVSALSETAFFRRLKDLRAQPLDETTPGRETVKPFPAPDVED